jgi:hypothetical protein
MGKHVACMGLKNLGNTLVVKPERTGIKGGILKIMLHNLCGTVWIGFIWFRREERCWFKHDNEH